MPPKKHCSLCNFALCQLCQSRKPFRIVHCHFCQHLAVYLNLRQFQAIHILALRQPVHPCRRINPRNPKPSELTFPFLTAHIRRSQRPHDSLFSNPVLLRPCAPVALCKPQYSVMFLSCIHSAFNSCHFPFPPNNLFNIQSPVLQIW